MWSQRLLAYLAELLRMLRAGVEAVVCRAAARPPYLARFGDEPGASGAFLSAEAVCGAAEGLPSGERYMAASGASVFTVIDGGCGP